MQGLLDKRCREEQQHKRKHSTLQSFVLKNYRAIPLLLLLSSSQQFPESEFARASFRSHRGSAGNSRPERQSQSADKASCARNRLEESIPSPATLEPDGSLHRTRQSA